MVTIADTVEIQRLLNIIVRGTSILNTGSYTDPASDTLITLSPAQITAITARVNNALTVLKTFVANTVAS